MMQCKIFNTKYIHLFFWLERLYMYHHKNQMHLSLIMEELS